MKISIYELLGLIKEGKAPKKIKMDSYILELDEKTTNWKSKYIDKQGDSLFLDYHITLNDEVEIIEKEKEIPIYNIDNMKIAGEKAGEVYRRLYEGFKKGWNAPIEEEKEIKKFHYNNAIWEEQARDLDYMFKDKIDELIDVINDMRDKE